MSSIISNGKNEWICRFKGKKFFWPVWRVFYSFFEFDEHEQHDLLLPFIDLHESNCLLCNVNKSRLSKPFIKIFYMQIENQIFYFNDDHLIEVLFSFQFNNLTVNYCFEGVSMSPHWYYVVSCARTHTHGFTQ